MRISEHPHDLGDPADCGQPRHPGLEPGSRFFAAGLRKAGFRLKAKVALANGTALILTSCSIPNAPADTNAFAAGDASPIPCAIGTAPFARVCTAEQVKDDAELVLTLRHPDGGFRRLAITRDGRGVIAADGAEPARVTVIGPGMIEVAIGDARYRLPATVKGGTAGQ